MRKTFYFLLLLSFFSSSTLFASDNFWEKVDYKGAFGTTNWASGWTALYHYGILADDATNGATITVTDADINAGDFVSWSADNTYILDGKVFVEEGATLHIEAGTVIKAKAGTGENASALIITRGGKIYADGTADRPIIFTSESDDVNNPVDVAYDTQGLWGGIILLGYAQINATGGETNIEGIPSSDARGLYGGNNDEDNSGVVRYVSIRHGGAEIGEGNEINGLTMGGVGNGTTIEYVEVYANKDDGFEWFGGTVNCKYLIAAFCGDDLFDHDEGLRNKMQFLFGIQHPDFGNHVAEHDGAPKSAVTNEPRANAIVYNATFLGSGQNSTNGDQERIFRIRENWGGQYNNSIFGDYNGYGLDIEDKYSPSDSKDRLAAGEIEFKNNIWFKVGSYTLADSIGRKDYVRDYLNDAANGNIETDPQLAGISRSQNAGLDPRPNVDGPAFDNLYGFVTAIENVTLENIPSKYTLSQNYPNPFNPVTNIKYSLEKAGQVELSVYNLLGQKIAILVNGHKNAGRYTLSWDASTMASGMYIYQLKTGSKVDTKRMMLIK
jgi:Secretion system C-terminal sorting domain